MFIPKYLGTLLLVSLCPAACVVGAEEGDHRPTYCNPLNIDYAYCPIPNFVTHGKHRTTADPVIIPFQGNYYLFSTNQWGYWWSKDLSQWTFVPRKFLKPWHKVYDELCAPGAFAKDGSLYLIGSTMGADFPLYASKDPRRDAWTEAVEQFRGGAWDPGFLVDDDNRVYMYYGSSNTFPIYGCELDAKTLQPIGERIELIRLDLVEHGWERFGEANDQTFLAGFMEGATVNKHGGKYYLQYAAPGTEFSGYADGVYTADKPLGPYTYQPFNPICYKPGGFARGAGHGATFQDFEGAYWRVATTIINDKNNFERRISMWPAGFDEEGVMYCNTAYGDYPAFLPGSGQGPANSDAKRDGTTPYDERSQFAGWMLLNYNKPVKASSQLAGRGVNSAVDEDLRTYWSAASGDAGEFIQSDLGAESEIHAVQINYADENAEIMGKVNGLFHQYRLEASSDEQSWTTIVDKSKNQRDIPHDYVALEVPIKARYVRLVNIHVPTGHFAISGLRVFGKGQEPPPAVMEPPVVLRGQLERRNAWIRWNPSSQATGYVLRFGVEPDKLYGSVMVYGGSESTFRAMNVKSPYYFTIEAFNEGGISPISEVVSAP